MDRTERLYKIDLLLNEQPGISFATLQDRLEVSRATLKRDLAYMKERLNAPIVFDRFVGGYRFDKSSTPVGDQYELPGLWFSAEEIHALLTMQHLLANLDTGGLLGPHIQPLLARLTALLGTGNNAAEAIQQRIFVHNVGTREFHLDHFQTVGSATLRRKRLLIDYFAKGKGELSQREVSPQRLVYYRNNWYLDAWCHLRDDIRAFALDSIRRAEVLEKKAKEVSAKSLDTVLGAGYGIFSGRKVQWAKLRFTPERARWVSTELWHPRQRGAFDADGFYVLEVPYADHRELLMDILKFGAEVEVLGPDELRQIVGEEARRLARLYA